MFRVSAYDRGDLSPWPYRVDAHCPRRSSMSAIRHAMYKVAV